jgi:hypothetical protein
MSLLEIDMDKYELEKIATDKTAMDENWVCRAWTRAQTQSDWSTLNNQFQGAGMAIFAINPDAAMDYWTLSDVAFLHCLEGFRL